MLKIIEDSIKNAVIESGQDESLANALIAWFRELANQNESIDNLEAVERRIALVMDKTRVDININD